MRLITIYYLHLSFKDATIANITTGLYDFQYTSDLANRNSPKFAELQANFCDDVSPCSITIIFLNSFTLNEIDEFVLNVT